MGSVVIIGAGAAGLAAARDLARSGREVFVLEARERIGGRIHTIRNAAVPIELGAEFVHGKSPAIWELAQADHLKLRPIGEHHWYFEDGKLTRSRAFWKQVGRLMDRMKSVDTDISFAEFLNSLPDDEETRRVKEMAQRHVEGFHAADITKAGIKGLVKANEAADSIDGEKSFRLENGYVSLAEALRAEGRARSVCSNHHFAAVVCSSSHGPRRQSHSFPTSRKLRRPFSTWAHSERRFAGRVIACC